MKVVNVARTIALTALLAVGSTGINKVNALRNNAAAQMYSNTDTFSHSVPPEGTDNPDILKNAPDPTIVIAGKNEKAAIIVDADNHILYRYDKDGQPVKAFLVATGKKGVKDADGNVISKGSPTKECICRVSHVEKSPYKTAPVTSKRYNNPAPYGKRIIILDLVNPATGKISTIGQFVHGTNKPASLGYDESNGCTRMLNDAIVNDVAPYMERGMFVLFTNSSEY